MVNDSVYVKKFFDHVKQFSPLFADRKLEARILNVTNGERAFELAHKYAVKCDDKQMCATEEMLAKRILSHYKDAPQAYWNMDDELDESVAMAEGKSSGNKGEKGERE